jgi:Desulfoferrodoxin, N-terminal domain
VTALGKRYMCPVCATKVLCLRAGPRDLRCCGQQMQPMSMEPLPSGD